MSNKCILTHPVNGYDEKGSKHSSYTIPHYFMPGLNTYSMNNINNCDEAIQYYSTSDYFNLPVPYTVFSEVESSNINLVRSLVLNVYNVNIFMYVEINAVLDMVNLKTKWKFENEKLLKMCKKKCSILIIFLILINY